MQPDAQYENSPFDTMHDSTSGGAQPYGTTPSGTRPPGSRMRLIGQIPAGVGVLLLVVTAVLGAMSASKAGDLQDTFDKGTNIEANKSETVQAEKDKPLTIWTVGTEAKKAGCHMNGVKVDVDNHTNSSLSLSAGDKSYDRMSTVTPKDSGSLKITCDSAVDVTTGDVAEGGASAIVGVVGSVLLGGLGLLLLVVGVVLWILGRNKVAKSGHAGQSTTGGAFDGQDQYNPYGGPGQFGHEHQPASYDQQSPYGEQGEQGGSGESGTKKFGRQEPYGHFDQN